ncbi:hypothetical protein N9H19_01740 [Flavobacteriales bacterium]|nr:hypothetical protein [Flavobacteriales bacterium]
MSDFSEERMSTITLKDVIVLINRIWKVLFLRKIQLFLFTSIFAFFGYLLAHFDTETYDAEVTFVIENNEASSPLGGLGGLASQFGVDVGGGSSNAFSQGNIEELVLSRRLIEDALMTSAVVNGTEDKLIHHFISISELNESLEESSLSDFRFPEDKEMFTFIHDSIIGIAYSIISSSNVFIDFKNETNIMSLKVRSENEDFSLKLVESLITKLDRFYISVQTAKSQLNLNFISNRADSVLTELQTAELMYADYKDSNFGVKKSKGFLQELRLQRKVQILNVMYSEIVKNLELSKFTSLNQKPLISIIDNPKLPLKSNLKSKPKYFILFAILGFFLASSFFVLVQFVKDELN